jgi:hypothetical protein
LRRGSGAAVLFRSAALSLDNAAQIDDFGGEEVIDG